MPWRVRPKHKNEFGAGWKIEKKTNSGWKVVGESKSKSKAEGSVRARYASKMK